MSSGTTEREVGIIPIHYNPVYIKRLFNEMADTYGFVNLIASFGFAALWRRQCLNEIDFFPGAKVIDMMTGMGELVPGISRRGGETIGIDISPRMCELAFEKTLKYKCRIIEADALNSGLPSESADIIVSSFGLKTFTFEQLKQLGLEVRRLLKPGGQFSMIEISPPYTWRFYPLYMFYIKHVIPFIGKVCLGNPENYRMLGFYTEEYNANRPIVAFREAGLHVNYRDSFYGCASLISGCR